MNDKFKVATPRYVNVENMNGQWWRISQRKGDLFLDTSSDGKTWSQVARHPLMTVNDVAAYLQVSRTTVYGFVRSGDLPARRVGERLRFTQAEIDRVFDVTKEEQ